MTEREHGGDIPTAAIQWGINEDEWLDLSTAISPFCYPLPSPPIDIWQRLPYQGGALISAAKGYYQCEYLLPLAGSQQGIELLPQVFKPQSVAVPLVGYSEHALQWKKFGHRIYPYRTLEELDGLTHKCQITIAVVINPNNPTGELIKRNSLHNIAHILDKNNGHLIVDEAFMDSLPQHSLISSLPKNALVLRSMGKFFGLAGVRVGFAIASPPLLNKLEGELGLWQISTPAQWAANLALNDRTWQKKQMDRLSLSSKTLELTLKTLFPDARIIRQSLFVTVELSWETVNSTYSRLATHGILIRKFKISEDIGLMRFGLTLNTQQDTRLLKCLNTKLHKEKMEYG